MKEVYLVHRTLSGWAGVGRAMVMSAPNFLGVATSREEAVKIIEGWISKQNEMGEGLPLLKEETKQQLLSGKANNTFLYSQEDKDDIDFEIVPYVTNTVLGE